MKTEDLNSDIHEEIICTSLGFERGISGDLRCSGLLRSSSGNFLLTFRENLSVPSSGFMYGMRPTGYPETSVRIYHYSLGSNPEQRSSQLLHGGSLKSHVAFLGFKSKQLPSELT